MTRARTICWTPERCEDAESFLATCDLIATDVETIPFRKPSAKQRGKGDWRLESREFLMTLVTYSGINNEGLIRSFAMPFVTAKSLTANVPTYVEVIHETCKRINANPVRKTLHNGVYDCAWFTRYEMPLFNYAYDSMTLWWSRYPDLPRTLDFVSSILLDHHQFWKQGRKETDFIQYCIYGMRDTESTLLCTISLLSWAHRNPAMLTNFINAHLRCLTGLSMSLKGMKKSDEILEEMEGQLHREAEEALARFRWLIADPEFNPNSPKQKHDLLYGKLGATPRNAKGRYVADPSKASTGMLPLKAIRTEHVIFKRVVNAMTKAQEPAKQISNVLGLRHFGGRFRTGYDGVGTTTSRFSSRGDAFGFGGNAQNIRKKYRRFCVADENSLILEIDFSAADDVFVSYESQEQKKIDVIERGLDTHSFNAAEVFFPHWTYDSVVKGKKANDPAVVHPITGIRQIVKKVTHGCNYLMHGLTLLMSAGKEAIVGAAKELGHAGADSWNQDQLVIFCAGLDEAYRAYYPRFVRAGDNSFYMELLRELKTTGGFTTIFNYKQHFLGDPREDSTLRAVAATSGQANTAGRVNMAMLELDHGIRQVMFRDGPAPDADEPPLPVDEESFGVSLRLQTHDSLTFNINYRHPRWQEGVERVFHVMRRPVVCKGRVIRVGLEGDVAFAWAHEAAGADSAEDIAGWLTRQGISLPNALAGN